MNDRTIYATQNYHVFNIKKTLSEQLLNNFILKHNNHQIQINIEILQKQNCHLKITEH